jgi:hypothetical protein
MGYQEIKLDQLQIDKKSDELKVIDPKQPKEE